MNLLYLSSSSTSLLSLYITPSSSGAKPRNGVVRLQCVPSSPHSKLCSCGRRHFMEATATALLPIQSSNASESHIDYRAILNKVRPPRPEWYEEFFALSMDSSMKSYEEEVAGYKSQLFDNLKGNAEKILEIGIGTGPNFKYYASNPGLYVSGIDPNEKMEKYAVAAAEAAGLAPGNFDFTQAVGEALPFSDASMDAVVGTLVLCSVTNVDATLKEVKRVLKPGGLYLFVEHVAAKDGSFMRIVQTILDPLEQAFADGCHLTRESGKSISEAGFLSLDINSTFMFNPSLISPLVYGIAYK